MNVKYIEFNGKHPKNSKQYRKYTDKPSSTWLSYGCSYDSAFLKVDIDDFDHKTGALEDSVKGKPRSEAIVEILDKLGVKYNGIQTEHGKHLFFRKPAVLEEGNKQNWHTPIGIKAEWKFPGRDDHIPLVINGVERQFFKGNLTNTDVDELPFYLYPLQKSKDKPFDLTFPSGDRTQKLGAYLFHLVKKGYSAEGAFTIVKLMNTYIFNDPIPDAALYSEILNDATLDKLKDQQRDKQLTPNVIADEIIDHYKLIRVNGDYYSYNVGVYKLFNAEELRAYITTSYPKLNGNFEREIIRHVEGRSYMKPPADDGTTNVKNGILSFDEVGNVSFKPHSPLHISFKQFNASYHPGKSSELLDSTLNQWFNHDSGQINLFQEMLGYLLMNHVNYQKVFFFIGPPSTGKSTVLKLITAFCGFENVSSITLEEMNKDHGLANLINKTANIYADLRNAKVHVSDRFKSLADGGGFEVNPKYRKSFTYSFTGKMLFGMNQYPDFSADFEGIERRVIIFRFNRVFKEHTEQFNPHLLEELTSDESLTALLNYAICGYQRLLKNKGFTQTKESGEALKDFVGANDNIQMWIIESGLDDEYFLREPINYQNKGLYPDYVSFCFNAGEPPKEQRVFSKYITNHFKLESVVKREKNDRYRIFRRKTAQ